MGDGYFRFKDPRTVRLMPVWHQIFSDLKLAPKIVLCLRDPAQVARSVKARDGLDLENRRIPMADPYGRLLSILG